MAALSNQRPAPLPAGVTSVAWREAQRAARRAAAAAYCRYSGFAVGASVIDESGRVFAGCNVENASYGVTICAERNAVQQAIAARAGRLLAVLIYVRGGQPATPCGACRQVMVEFLSPDACVCCECDGKPPVWHRVGELLPHRFEIKQTGKRGLWVVLESLIAAVPPEGELPAALQALEQRYHICLASDCSVDQRGARLQWLQQHGLAHHDIWFGRLEPGISIGDLLLTLGEVPAPLRYWKGPVISITSPGSASPTDQSSPAGSAEFAPDTAYAANWDEFVEKAQAISQQDRGGI